MPATDLGQRPAAVLCPPLLPDTAVPTWHDPLAAALAAAGIPVIALRTRPGPHPGGEPEDERMRLAGWVADQAVAVTASGVDRGLVLLAHGSAIPGLPALSLSQRAARRSVVGYVLVDGHPPRPGTPATADWPNAPVLYLRSPGAPPLGLPAAQTRGWRCVHGDPVQVLPSQLDAWPDPPLVSYGTLES